MLITVICSYLLTLNTVHSDPDRVVYRLLAASLRYALDTDIFTLFLSRNLEIFVQSTRLNLSVDFAKFEALLFGLYFMPAVLFKHI